MTATFPPETANSQSKSVDPAEVAKFSALAAQWWDPAGKFAPLHKFNPVRLSFIRTEAAIHFGRDPRAIRPFEGYSLLDIGCGGGLLSEPMARLGFAVTGADASEKPGPMESTPGQGNPRVRPTRWKLPVRPRVRRCLPGVRWLGGFPGG